MHGGFMKLRPGWLGWGSVPVRRRGEQAGLTRLHPHQLRHTFPHAWLPKLVPKPI
jgi:integrase